MKSLKFHNLTWTVIVGVIFLILAGLHVLRILFGWEVVVNGWQVPMWLSWVGVVLLSSLGYVGIGGKLMGPFQLIRDEIVGWCRAYWASQAKDKLPYIAILVSSLGLVFSSWYTSHQLTISSKQLELANRPYLYVDIVPSASVKMAKSPDGKEYEDLYLGAKLVYKNVGKLPACDIKTEVHMYNNADKGDDAKRLEEWYVKEKGYFPRPTTLFPEQTGQEIGLFVDAGEGATQYLITIRVSYTGEDSRKKYWYSADMRYEIDKDIIVRQEVKVIRDGGQAVQVPLRKDYGIWLLETNTDYDRVGHRQMSPVLLNPYQ